MLNIVLQVNEIEYDSKGFIQVDQDKCIRCGLCEAGALLTFRKSEQILFSGG